MSKKTHETIENPFTSEIDNQTFYLYPSLSQRLHMTLRLLEGTSQLIFILGEKGSGKSLLMAQIMAQDEIFWKGCRIHTRPVDDGYDGDQRGHRAFMYSRDEMPLLMMDDADQLKHDDLLFLIGLTGITGSPGEIDKLVLLGEPSFLNQLSSLMDSFSGNGTVEKIYMPQMTLAETGIYLDKHVKVAGMNGEAVFTLSDKAYIHDASGGYPGRINRVAAPMFDKKCRHGKGLTSFFKHFFPG